MRIRFILAILTLSGATLANAQLSPGNSQLRSDLQLLSDWQVITGPTSTWPLPNDALQEVEALLSCQEQEKYPLFVLSAAKRLVATQPQYRATLNLNSALPTLHSYQKQNLNDQQVDLSAAWQGQAWSSSITAIAATKDSADNSDTVVTGHDNDQYRIHNSHITGQLGNWAFSAGNQDRWWGPGWQGSLILSNNARPIPSISVQRVNTEAFESPWLSWIGPWQLTTVFGQFESDRHIPNALFFAMRANFRPTKGLEIGLSRAAQWGGKGRPKDLKTFGRLFFGNDNRSDNLTVDKEPGNQLGGIDLRYTRFWNQTAISGYTQWIGEDEAGGLPSKYSALFGLETSWGDSYNNQHRLAIEHSNTTAAFNTGDPEPNVTYRHSIYRTGYNYYGRTLGHSAGNDSRISSVHYIGTLQSGSSVYATITNAKINYDGGGAHPISSTGAEFLSLELAADKTLSKSWKLGLSAFYENGRSNYSDRHGAAIKLSYGW